MSKYLMGGWMDERIPDIDDLLKDFPTVNADEFKEGLGKRLGIYRFHREHQFPALSTEKAELKKYIKALKALESYLAQPFNLPPIAKSILVGMRLKHGSDDDNKNLYHSILKERFSAEKALAALNSRYPPRRGGRRSEANRDRLFSEIVEKLCSEGATITAAREVAGEILARANIEMPFDEREVRRAHAKGGYKLKK